MMFLLRATFWLGLVLVLLPSGGTTTSKPDTQISATDAVSAASAAVADMRGFCDRQPTACEIGSQAATAIGQRAQAGAKMLYELLVAEPTSESAATGTIASGPAPASMPASQNTLLPGDTAPAWRGPRKDARPPA